MVSFLETALQQAGENRVWNWKRSYLIIKLIRRIV